MREWNFKVSDVFTFDRVVSQVLRNYKVWSCNARKYSSSCFYRFAFLSTAWYISVNSHMRVQRFFRSDFRSKDAKFDRRLVIQSKWWHVDRSDLWFLGAQMGVNKNFKLISVFIFFSKIFRSFCWGNKVHFTFRHLRMILQPCGEIFIFPQKWCINYANLGSFRIFSEMFWLFMIRYIFFQKAHFIHFQMTYSSPHCCKYLLRKKLNMRDSQICHFFLCTEMR